MANPSLAGNSVIVTGGASGIGLGIVKFFAHHSSHISILDIPSASAQSTLSSLRAEFPSTKIQFSECDIADWEQQKAAFERVYQEVGRVDIVVANAGISERGRFLGTAGEGDAGVEVKKPDLRTLDVNLSGTLYTIKLAVHFMRKNKSAQKGSIICTASDAGIYPFPVAPIYAASKHALVGTVRSLARPLGPEGIQINALCPSVIKTNIANEKLFSNMILTPMSTLVRAVEVLVSKPELSGVCAEIHGEEVTFRSEPAFVDKDTETNWEEFWRLGYA